MCLVPLQSYQLLASPDFVFDNESYNQADFMITHL